VHALVNNLNAVVATASKDRMPTVDRLRAAVTDVSSAMDGYAATGADNREALGAVRQAQRQLEEALRALRDRSDQRSHRS
jgi:ABC-type transporter Mla subunit MlaD